MVLRLLFAAALAVAATAAVELADERRRDAATRRGGPLRRGLAAGGLGAVLFVALFLPLTTADLLPPDLDPSTLTSAELFAFQLLLAAGVAWWALVGGGGAAAVGLATPRPGREVAVGTVAGVLAWGLVLGAALAVAAVVALTAGEERLAELTAPSPLVLWVAGQPLVVRILVSLSAGVVEETFFRGLLQPRIGIAASTTLFVLGHVAYGQTLMLFGVTVLSLLYALLARWRGNVVAAITAHALFDLVQLLVVIPAARRALESGLAPVALCC